MDINQIASNGLKTCKKNISFSGLKKVFAFTLAEILITLGIIGVIAAMTLPTLTKNIYEKQTITKLKATYSIVARALRLCESENGDATTWGLKGRWSSDEAQIIANNLKPYFKIALDCGLNDSQKKCISKNYKQKNGAIHNINFATDTRYYKIVLANGTSIWWKSSDSGEYNSGRIISLYVDTNGVSPPNVWGKDLFLFGYDNGTFVPAGAPNSVHPYERNCLPKNSNGWGCTWYVLQHNSMDYLQ